MSARVVAFPVPTTAAARPALAVLVVGALLWLLLFHSEAAAAVGVWISSTAYGHCFLVLPVAAWLARERRAALADIPPRPAPAVALAAVPLGMVWLAAERLGVMEGRQLAAMGLLLVLCLAVLGWRLAYAFAVPLGYLLFLVPFGGFLVAPLQVFTAHFIDTGLDVLGIPHVVTRFVIEIPEGRFRVAEACAGLRFLIAAIAFGVVYACTLYRSVGRRLVFIAVSTIVPVLANGVRALGIVLMGHLRGSAEAGAVDHVVYGWLFFSLVILLLILLGLPFRQDWATARSRPVRVTRPAPTTGWLAAAAASVLLLSSVGPVCAAMLEAAADRQEAALPPDAAANILAKFITPTACTRLPSRSAASAEFVCAGVPIAVAVRTFAPRVTAAPLMAARRAAPASFDADTVEVEQWRPAGPQGVSWEVTGDGVSPRIVATGLWIGANIGRTGLAFRLQQARDSVYEGGVPPTLIVVTAGRAGVATADVTTALQSFLADQDVALHHLGQGPARMLRGVQEQRINAAGTAA